MGVPHPVDLYSVMVCPESPSWFWIKVQEKKNSSEAFSPPSLALTQTKFRTTSSVAVQLCGSGTVCGSVAVIRSDRRWWIWRQHSMPGKCRRFVLCMIVPPPPCIIVPHPVEVLHLYLHLLTPLLLIHMSGPCSILSHYALTQCGIVFDFELLEPQTNTNTSTNTNTKAIPAALHQIGVTNALHAWRA